MKRTADMNDNEFLNGSKKLNDGFNVPEGYFDDLSKKMQEKIASGNQSKTVRLHSYFSTRNIAIAASVAALIIAGLLIIPAIQNNSNSGKGLSNANQTEIPAENLMYDESVAMQNDADYQQIDLNEEMEIIPVAEHFATDTTITDEDIIQYLSNEDLDTDLLAEL
jgi:hypothetical protein